jgi:hypothetical protein
MKGCTRPFAHGRLDATSVGEFPIGTAPVQRNNHPMGCCRCRGSSGSRGIPHLKMGVSRRHPVAAFAGAAVLRSGPGSMPARLRSNHCRLGTGIPGPLVALVAGVSGLALTAWVLGDSQALRHAYYTSLEERAPGWKPSVTRRHGSPLPQSAAANCRKDAPARSTSPPHQRRDRQHAVHLSRRRGETRSQCLRQARPGPLG